MALEPELHPVQTGILRVLLFNPLARFSELNAHDISSDHLTFHVKRLVELDLIEKSDEQYRLTVRGKEFANRFDTDQPAMKVERQAKIAVSVGCVREKNGVREYLMQQRLKQPYYGLHGFVSGKMRWGETVLETAARELEEETGLVGTLTLVGIIHKMDYTSGGALLEDKFFFIVRADDVRGTLRTEFEGGRNFWLPKRDVLKLPNLFPDVEEVLEVRDGDDFVFLERKYTVERY
jgi:ADP-ribose pyrophosphatase YjhB (NUDIX family)